MNELSSSELRRYSRHLLLPEVGLEGQAKLKQASVLLIGAGGLGSPLALYLAAAGVGRLGIVDDDVVDESNLQRQVLHGTSGVGKSKLESARERIADLNPHVHVETHNLRLTSANALGIFKQYDIVADGSDNFPTRYLVNDASRLAGIPNVYGSILGFEGQVAVFNYRDGPCYRCLFSEPPPPGLVPTCEEGGVLGVLPGVIGGLQANEVIKVLLGMGEIAAGRMLIYDALRLKFREVRLPRNKNCRLCGEAPQVTELIDYEVFCGLRPEQGSTAEEGHAPEVAVEEERKELSPTEYADMRATGREHILLDVRESFEIAIAEIKGALAISLGDLPSRANELDPNLSYVILCKSGGRSRRAQELLEARGFQSVLNLAGGINAWSRDVDPDVPLY